MGPLGTVTQQICRGLVLGGGESPFPTRSRPRVPSLRRTHTARATAGRRGLFPPGACSCGSCEVALLLRMRRTRRGTVGAFRPMRPSLAQRRGPRGRPGTFSQACPTHAPGRSPRLQSRSTQVFTHFKGSSCWSFLSQKAHVLDWGTQRGRMRALRAACPRTGPCPCSASLLCPFTSSVRGSVTAPSLAACHALHGGQAMCPCRCLVCRVPRWPLSWGPGPPRGGGQSFSLCLLVFYPAWEVIGPRPSPPALMNPLLLLGGFVPGAQLCPLPLITVPR